MICDIEIQALIDAPYRVQGMHANDRGEKCRGKAYETLNDAITAAKAQSTNQTNVKSGNKFIVFKVVAVVGIPAIPMAEPLFVDTLEEYKL